MPSVSILVVQAIRACQIALMNTDDLYRLLRTGHARAQGIVDTIAAPLLVLDEALCVQAANHSFFKTFRVDRYETMGKPLFELGDNQWDITELRHLLSNVIPKSTAIIDYEVTHDFPALGLRTMLLTARTLYQPDGGSRSILLSIADVTDQQRREAEKDLLFGELRHRIRNLLGVIQALAAQTTTAGRSTEEYRNDLLGRLSALIEAENFSFDEQDSTDLKDLIGKILAPYAHRSNAVLIEPGAGVDLTHRQVTSLSMVLHEMATNATKYGALSVAEGQVRITWRVDTANNLTLNWTESGGPPVTAPADPGFGSKLILSTVQYNLQGQVELVYSPEGYKAEIVVPLWSGAS